MDLDKEIQVGKAMGVAEGFATVFKIPDVVTMPNYAKGIRFVEAYGNLGPICQELTHAR